MKKILFLSFAVIAMTFSACKEDEPNNNGNGGTEQTEPGGGNTEGNGGGTEGGSGNTGGESGNTGGESGNTGGGDEVFEDGVYILSASATTAAIGDTVTFTIKGNDVSTLRWFLCSNTEEMCFGVTFVDGVGSMPMDFDAGTVDFYAHYYKGAEEVCTNAVEMVITE